MASKNRRPHSNGNFPPPPPKRRDTRSTFDGCAVTAVLILAGALITAVGGPILAAYMILY